MTNDNRPAAVVWDYDGTLVDTRFKNFAVTRRIVERISGQPSVEFPALVDLEGYRLATLRASNWRDLYRTAFGFSEEETDRAGPLWTEYQLADNTEVPVFEGISDVMKRLAGVPHGIVSQNSRASITERLQGLELWDRIESVVGFEEVDLRRQKPEPDGLLDCLRHLTDLEQGYAVYIGDHEGDALCAAAADSALRELGAQFRVFSIGACYASVADSTADWPTQPDFEARTPADIVAIVDRLARQRSSMGGDSG